MFCRLLLTCKSRSRSRSQFVKRNAGTGKGLLKRKTPAPFSGTGVAGDKQTKKRGLPFLTSRAFVRFASLLHMQFFQFFYCRPGVEWHPGPQQPVQSGQPLFLFLRIGSGRQVANARSQILKGFRRRQAKCFCLHCLQAMAVPLHPFPEFGHIHPFFAE